MQSNDDASGKKAREIRGFQPAANPRRKMFPAKNGRLGREGRAASGSSSSWKTFDYEKKDGEEEITLPQIRHRPTSAKCRCIRGACCGACGCSHPAFSRRGCGCPCNGPARQKYGAFPVPRAWEFK